MPNPEKEGITTFVFTKCLILVYCLYFVSGDNIQDDQCVCSPSSEVCYVSMDTPMTYDEASTHCGKLDQGSLVKLDPAPQVMETIQKITTKYSRFWIGLDDTQTEGVYRWTTDSTTLDDQNRIKFRSYNNEDLDCVVMDGRGNFKLKDCNDRFYVTCETDVCDDDECSCYNVKFGAGFVITAKFDNRCISTYRKVGTFLEQRRNCQSTGAIGKFKQHGEVVQLDPWDELKQIVMTQIAHFGENELTWILNDKTTEDEIIFTSNNETVSTERFPDFNAANSPSLNCVVVNNVTGLLDYAHCGQMHYPFVCQATDCSASKTPSVMLAIGLIVSSVTIILLLAVVLTVACCKWQSKRLSSQSPERRNRNTEDVEDQNNGNIGLVIGSHTPDDTDPRYATPDRNSVIPLVDINRSSAAVGNGGDDLYEDSKSMDSSDIRTTETVSRINSFKGENLIYEDVDSVTSNEEGKFKNGVTDKLRLENGDDHLYEDSKSMDSRGIRTTETVSRINSFKGENLNYEDVDSVTSNEEKISKNGVTDKLRLENGDDHLYEDSKSMDSRGIRTTETVSRINSFKGENLNYEDVDSVTSNEEKISKNGVTDKLRLESINLERSASIQSRKLPIKPDPEDAGGSGQNKNYYEIKNRNYDEVSLPDNAESSSNVDVNDVTGASQSNATEMVYNDLYESGSPTNKDMVYNCAYEQSGRENNEDMDDMEPKENLDIYDDIDS
ncbi:uncharacterized protein [Apostichopus japonicus]|uniref:uncharacterized protein isoform X2 n=1 Tax=Stichopus japonicus TaxID=307972 RepID=UPI003AB8C0ED